jgi:hypothetical protein
MPKEKEEPLAPLLDYSSDCFSALNSSIKRNAQTERFLTRSSFAAFQLGEYCHLGDSARLPSSARLAFCLLKLSRLSGKRSLRFCQREFFFERVTSRFAHRLASKHVS